MKNKITVFRFFKLINLLIVGCALLLSVANVKAQVNLVPNPSFEDYDTCPDFTSQISRAIGWWPGYMPGFFMCNIFDLFLTQRYLRFGYLVRIIN